MEKKTLEEMLEKIDIEFIENEPIEAYDLFRWMEAELYHRKDYIESQAKEIQNLRREVLLLRSMLEVNKD